MSLIRSAFDVIRRHRRAYVVLNVAFYGVVVCAMVAAALDPGVQGLLRKATHEGLTQGPLAAVARAYTEGNVILAMVLTFVVNLSGGAFLSITLPSLIIPFSGLLMGGARAAIWGVIMSPASPDMRLAMIPHLLTLILEGQAYVLTMLAACVQGNAFLRPRSVGAEGHGRGYWLGLKDSARLYVLIIVVLAVAAVYEAVEVIYWVGPLAGGP